jgi:YD repeat-containing protein
MVAIVSGNSVGLSLTSFANGQNVMTGSAALGRQGQDVYVNSANGNLVLQHSDDRLNSTGIDVFATRTYNSQGTFDGDGSDDNWRLGFFRSLDNLTGTLNTRGSTITRTDADGARTIYQYADNSGVYVNAEGAGAHDTLSYDAANRQWLWTDGSSRTVETYSWADGAGKLVRQTDPSGNRIDFVYTGNRLTEVRDQSGEKQLLIYTGNNLTELRSVKQDGAVVTRVRYGYDDLNRLNTVTVDLTPEDNSVADGKTYVTTYSYDGDSKRLAGVAETDGTQAQFTYKQIGTAWQVDTLTQVVDGVARTTRFSYDDVQNAVPVSVAVDASLLDTIGDQTIQMNPAVDSSQFTTSEVGTNGENVILDSTYLIKSGDTWAGITQALYHTTETSAVAALKAALGGPSLTPGAKLTHVPGTLSFAVIATNVTVPPYYRVREGDTWEGITYGLYHTRDQEAVAALRAVAGNPPLSAGLQLDGVPTTLKYVKTPTICAETRITDSLGNLTLVTSDSKGRLTKIVGPQVDGVSQSVTYTYDSSGNMLSQTDAMGNTSTFSYDNAGNQISSTDRMGNVVTRKFGANNQLLSETVQINTPKSAYSFSGTKYFVYDSRNRLRFTVSDGDSVTEYRYDAAGNRSSVIKYPGQAYTSSSFGETDLASWVSNIADKSTIQRTDYGYDFRGQVTSITAWAKVGTTGTGVADGSQSVTTMVYDQAGQLLQTIAPNGLVTNTTYDGLGRVLTTTDNAGASTTAVYDDAGNRVLTTQANGLVTTSVYDQAGELKSVVKSDSHGVLGETRYWYDATGHLRVTQDPDGGKHAYLYDAAGRMSGEIDAAGRLVEYKYNANGDRTLSITYATLVAPTFMARALDLAQATAGDQLDQALHLTLDGVRPAASATDVKTWNLYDADDRLVWQIDALGYATQTLYDGESRAYATNRLATPIDVSLLKDGSDVLLTLLGSSTSVQLTETPASGTAGAHTYVAVVTAAVPGMAVGTVSFFAGPVLLGSAAVVNNVATFTALNLPAGHSDITAVYSGDAVNTGSTSKILGAEAVQTQPTSVTLSADLSGAVYGAPLGLSATVSGTNPSGTVAFYSDDTAIGYGAVRNGVATLSLGTLPVGAHSLKAVYLGDAANAGSTSNLFTETIGLAPSAVTVTSSDGTTNVGTEIMLTANVTGASPTGTVTFYDQNGEVLGTARVITGVATAVIKNEAAGVTHVVAAYSGDIHNAGSVSSVFDESVETAITHTALYVDTFDTPNGRLTTLTARVTGFSPQGEVDFYGPDNQLLGWAGVGNGNNYASLPLLNASIQPGDIRAVYSGDANNATSVAQRVDSVPTRATLTSTQNDTNVISGSTWYLYPKVAGAAPGGTMALLDEKGNILQTAVVDSTFNANMRVVVGLPAGQHNLTLVYYGNANTAPAVKAVSLLVNPASSSTSMAVSDPHARVGQSVVYTAKITSSQNQVPIAGRVQFRNSSTGMVLGTASVVDGVATLNPEITTASSGYVYADYLGDSYRAPSSGAVYVSNQVVTDAPRPVAALSAGATTLQQGAPLTLSATVTTADGSNDAALIDSIVSFYNGSELLGTARTDAAGVATLTTSIADVGIAHITAVAARMMSGSYSSNNQYEQAITDVVDVGVTAAATPPATPADTRPESTTTLAFSSSGLNANPSTTVDTPITLTATVTGGGIPTDTPVAFYNRGKIVGVGRWDGSSASINLGNLPAGDYAFTAVFGGASGLRPSGSVPRTLAVNTVATTTQLLVNPVVGGARNEYRLLAQVSGLYLAHGTVNFYNGAELLGKGELGNGVAMLTVALPGGAAALRAEYEGDAVSSASKSAEVKRTVFNVATEVVLTSSAASTAIGAPLVLSASVQGIDPHGVVTFFDGDTLLGSANLNNGVATFTVDNLPLGNRALRAVYTHDPRNALNASATSNVLTQAVERSPAFVLTVDRTRVIGNTPLVLTATFGDAGATGTVCFMDGSTVLGTADIVNGQAFFAYRPQVSGMRDLHAVYDGDGAAPAASSALVALAVLAEPTSISISSVTPSTRYGDPVTLVAKVAGDNPTGTVTFVAPDGSVTFGAAPVIDGVATLTLSRALTPATYQIAASYSGDTRHVSSVAGAITQTVTTLPSSVTLSSPVGSLSTSDTLVLTAQLAPNGNAAPGGQVYFYDGDTSIGYTLVQADGMAQMAISTLAVGMHTIRATYSGNNGGIADSAVKNTLSIEITGKARPTISVSPRGSVSVSQSQPTTLRATLGGGASPTGVVTFTATGGASGSAGHYKVLGTANVVNGVASLNVSATDIGNDYRYVGVSYTGDANNAAVVSTDTLNIYPTYVTRSETRTASSVSLGYTTEATALGSRLYMRATIGDAAATGTVSFYTGDILVGSANVVNGEALFTILPATNALNVTAVYSGDGTRAPSTATLAVTAAQPATAVTVMVPSGRLLTSSSYTIPVRADGPYRDGTVELFVNGVSRGTWGVSGGMVNCGVDASAWPAPGTYSVQAKFTASGNRAVGTSSTVQFVAIAPTSMILSASPRNPSFGAEITLTSVVSGNNPTGTVTFYDGGAIIGSANVVDGVATLTTRREALGSAYWQAVYGGDTRNAAASDRSTFYSSNAAVVQSVSTVTGLAIEVVDGPNGPQQKVTATVTGLKPSGIVTFFDCNGTPLGTASVSETDLLSQGRAVFVLPGYVEGKGVASATYSDVQSPMLSVPYNATSVSTSVRVPAAPARIAVSSSDALPIQGLPVTLRADVTGLHPGGVVVFFGGDNKEIGRAAIVDGSASVTVDRLPAGTNNITAMYAGDADNGFVAGRFVQQVAQSHTSITLDIPTGRKDQGAPVILTATVARPGTGYATGNVTFYNGATAIGSADLFNGHAVLSLSSLPVGTNQLSVRYSGDADNVASRSEAVEQVTVPAPVPTTISVSSTPAQITGGQKFTLTAKVTGFSGQPVTGQVTFFNNYEAIGTAQVVDGVAVLESTYYGSSGWISVAYSGDAANASSSFDDALYLYAVTGSVAAPARTTAPTNISFDATPTAVTYGESSTLRVGVTVPDSSHPPTGSVIFFDGTRIVGSAPVVDGVATLDFTNFKAAATQQLNAVYSGDQYNSPTSRSNGLVRTLTMAPASINPVLRVSRLATGNPRYLRLEATVAYPTSAMAAQLDGNTWVEFFVGTRSIGRATLVGGQAIRDYVDPHYVGSGTITAVYHDVRATGTSAPVAVSVTAEPVKMSLAVSPATAVAGDTVTLTATPQFNNSRGYTTYIGSYSFFDGDVLLGSVNAGSGNSSGGSLTIKNVAAGQHQYRVVYSGNPAEEVGISYSTPVPYTVGRLATATIKATEVALDAQNNVVGWTSPAARTAKVTVTAVGNPTPTGTVVLYSSTKGERLGSAQLVGGQAVFLVPGNNLLDYSHSYNLVYSGDDYNEAAEVTNIASGYGYGGGLVNTSAGSVVLSSRPDPQGRAGMVELYATVKGANPTGAITFNDAYGNVLGTSAIQGGVACLILPAPADGLSGVTAFYRGDAFNVPRTVTYTRPGSAALGSTTTTLTASQNTVELGTSVVLTAQVSGARAPGGSVTFYDGTTILGTVALQNGSAVLATSAMIAGINHLTAVYTGDAANAASMSAAVDETIMGAPVTVRLKAPAGPVRQGAAVTYTATVEGNVPGGVVTFVSGKTVLGTAQVVRGVATLNLAGNAFDVGTATIVASYAGDAGNAPAISQAVQQTVTVGVRQVVIGTSVSDRKVWNYVDTDGRLRISVDAENYPTQYFYDSANRLVKTVTYAQPLTSTTAAASYESSGVGDRYDYISSWLPSSNAADRITYCYYDNMGRKVGEVDAEGYLSEYVYDKASRVIDTIRYATPARVPASTTSTLASLRPAATAEDHHTRNEYDLHDQLVRQTAADGTVTEYTYDVDGHVTSAIRARGTGDARGTLKRYDTLGRLAAQLDAVGAALIVDGMHAADVDAIWAEHGTRYTYDAAGRLTSTSAPMGQRNVYFYDDEGQLRFTVNALGEVTENGYDTFGRQTATTRYATRLADDAVKAMVGGLLSDHVNDAALTALAAARAAHAAQNSVTQARYDAAGNTVERTDAMGHVSSATYNAFGEVVAATQPGTIGGADVTTVHNYDRRGLETSTVQRTDKIYVVRSTQYDAFGRVIRSIDANGNVSQTAYDRLGRVVQTTDAAGGKRSATYDAFDRQLTTTDALNNVTRYAYDTAARGITVTTAENVVTTTLSTRNGQVLSVRDGNANTTSYHYDANGNLLDVISAAGSVINEYDAANRLVLTRDPNGTEVTYTYDAANRRLTRTVDGHGLDLRTRYEYDVKGQAVRVTDPSGVVTTTEYDLDGAMASQTYDAEGAGLKTVYTNDARGRVVRVQAPDGALTDYVYDDLGRRIRTIADPTGLALTENYEYDKNGNVVARTDPNGNRTRYVYDGVNRLAYTIDPLGYVKQNTYDAEGWLTRTTVYAQALTLNTLAANPSLAVVTSALTVSSTLDTVNYHVYDKDGRLAYDVDGLGGVTAYKYDGNGNVISRLTYANRINMSGWTVGTAPAPLVDATRDLLVRTVYDAMNRPVYTIDGTGGVTAMSYDAVGNLIESVRYAGAIATTTPTTAPAVAAALAAVTDSGVDVHMRYRYDSAGRKIWEADSLGQVTGFTYDDAGNLTKTVAYAQKIAAQEEPSSVTAGGGDRVTLMGYDVRHRMTVQVDQSGVVTCRAFDANGNVVSVTTRAAKVAVPTAASTIALADQASADAALDHTVRSVYDAANREIYRIDGLGNVTEKQYDANGKVVTRIDYAKPIPTTTAATPSAVAAAVTAIADNAHDVRTRNVYDADGLLIWSVRNGRDLTGYTYNNLGELLRKTVYAKAFTAEQTDFSPAALATAAQAAANAAQDGLAVKVYDKAGQLVWNIDGAGTVTSFSYDTSGNQIAQVVYAQKFNNPASLANGATPGVTGSPYDVRSYKVYDAANRLAWSIDGTGGVTHYSYDGKGQLVETRAYATRINLGIWTVGTVPTVVPDAADAINRTVYDADGRAVFTIDGTGHVVEMKYDRDGNMSERIRYVNPVPLTTAAIRAALTAALGSGDVGDLHERFAYDEAGRVLFRADAAGHVTGFMYDTRGNVTRQVSYAETVGASAALSSVRPGSQDQVVLTAYDTDNRVVMQIDGSGQIVRKTIDAFGNVTKSVSYANRVARPTADSASLSAAAMADLIVPDSARDRVSVSVFDADRNEVYSVDANGVVTARQFDALGIVTIRTVYFATVNVPTTADPASMAALVAGIANATRDDQMRYVYDQAGRVLYSIDAAGDVNSYAYTATGQVMSTRTYLRKATAATTLTASALSSLVSGATPNARVDYVYDAADRLAYEVDTAGGVIRHEYDGEGNEIKRTAYATRINRAQFTPGTVPAVTADALRDSSVRTVYDGLGRPSFTIDRDGYVVALKYDVMGHVSERVAYGRRIDPQTPGTAAAISAAVQLLADPALDTRDVSVYGAGGRLAWSMTRSGQVTGYTYDAHGNLVKQVAYATPVPTGAAPQSVVAAAGDKVTLAAYDADNRPVVSVDATGRVTKLVYDADGNVLQRTIFANLADAPTAQSGPIDGMYALPAADAINDRVVRSVYDNAGREIYSIDQAGAVTATRYDGMAVEHKTYAKAVPPNTAATAEALASAVQLVADATHDRFARSVYDASGKLVSSTDARGNVTSYNYDAAGNRIETVTPESKTVRQVFDTQGRVLATVNELGAATGFAYDVYGNAIRQIQYSATVSATYDPAALSATPAAGDRVNLMAYDQNGRLIYAIDGEGVVRQQQFDGAGNMVALTIYATTLTTATVAAEAYGVVGIAAQVKSAPGEDRTSRQVFDAANHLIYSVDPLGFTQKFEYDARGQLTAQTRFAKSVLADGAFGAWTVTGLDARVTVDTGHDRTEYFEYNALGQVTRHTDAEGKVEATDYDKFGWKKSFTDKNQNAWTYEYDAAGHLAKETSPEVMGKDGTTVRRIVTMEYDALGQMLKRSEAGDGQTIITAFAYDNLGNQVSIDFGKLTGYVPGGTTATQGTNAVVTMVYNRFGKVITKTDVAGYVGRNVYDEIGQLRYEIDAKGNVTEYTYNSTGEQISLTRYDGAITVTQDKPTVADIATQVAKLDQTKRRTITTTYDMDGRALQVTQPAVYVDDSSAASANRTQTAGAQVRYVYDAFGSVIQTSRLLNASTSTWLIDNNYYDQRGLLQATVDAAGYKTTYGYDSAGNVTAKREYATAIAGWTGNRLVAATATENANDRITATAYDKDGRVVRESLTDGSGKANNEHVRVTEYDGAGNVTLTKAWGPGATDSDAPTRMFYDALDRLTAVIDGTHKTGAGYGLTTYRYNLAGKVVRQTQYAQGSVSAVDPTPAAANADDRVTTTEYDEQGNAIHVVNPEGLSQYFAYDKRGLQTDTWSIGRGLSYTKDEAFGRFTRTYDEVGRLLTDSCKSVSLQYNAFGEMTRRQQGTDVTFYDYDTAGRMWRTNENGHDEIYVFDLLGRRTSVLSSDGADGSNYDIKAYASVANANTISAFLHCVEYKYDVAGNVATETAPSRGSYRPVTTYAYDRWHNLLGKTEPAATTTTVAPGPTTRYTYDMQNRVTSESYARADGTAGGRVRTFEYAFGPQGALVGRKTVDRESAAVTGDADNNANHARYRVTTETFTVSGKLLRADTNGIVIEKHTYDAFDQVLTDEVTADRVVRYTYNHAGQVTGVTHAPVDIYGVTQSAGVMQATRSDTRALTESFAYDELGYLIGVTNGAGEVTSYKHDVYGNVIWTKTPASAATSATWDANGRKLTATDALGQQAKWDYDSYGRLKTMTGYDGSVTTYTYDNRSQLRMASQPGKGQTVTYTYDGAGQVKSITDYNNGSFGYLSLNKVTTYSFDLAGNRLTEKTVQGGSVFADNTFTYDALHRVVNVQSGDMGQGVQKIAYEYDGFGNRSRYTSTASGKGADRNQDGYFFYDALNRVTVSGALDANGTIGGATERRTYDEAGNLKTAGTAGHVESYGYDAMNRLVSTSVNGQLVFQTAYDAAGRVVLTGEKSATTPAITSGVAAPVEPVAPVAPTAPPAGSTQAQIDAYNAQKAQYDKDKLAYDAALAQYKSDLQDYNDQNAYLDDVSASTAASPYERHVRAYDAQGRLVVDHGLKDDGSLKTMMTNDAFDAAGNVLAYHTDAMVNDHIRSDYTNTYRTLTNGVVQASSTGHMTVLSGKLSGKTGSNATSTNVYDANGNLVGVDYTTAGDAPKSGTSRKIFIVDAHGNILLSREQSWNSPTVEQRQILVGDELELRYSINYGSFGDIQDEQKKSFWDAYNADAYQSMVTPGGTITAEAGDNPTTGQVVVVREGDTLQSIAQRVYGTADAWYRIADANNLEHGSVLVAGMTVVAPAAAADTNKLDFNMGKLVGSTAPNLPPPPPDKKNCITLIIVAVAVVVACVVAPYMAGFVAGMGLTGTAATVAAGALTAAAANVASQAVGIAAGVQDGMDWRSVGKSAIGGAIGAGFNAVAGDAFDGLSSSAYVNAGVSNIASQGVMIAAHQQKKFSWASVAGAAVSAGVGNSDAMKDIQQSMRDNGWSAFAQGAVRSGLSGFAGSLTTDLIVPGKQDWAQIGISAFHDSLASGLENQRLDNYDDGKPFLFDDALSTAGRRTGEVVGNALGNSLAPSAGEQQAPDRVQRSGDSRTASLTDLDFSDNAYGQLRARLAEYGPDARADFASREILEFLDRTAENNGGILPKGILADDEPGPTNSAEPEIPKVVVTGKRLDPQAQEDWYKYQMRASMPNFGRTGPSSANPPKIRLGNLSMKYETRMAPSDYRKAAGVVSSGKGDPGGISYGAYQLASNVGKVQDFLKNNGAPWASQFAGMDPTVKGDFGKTWKNIAAEPTDDFFNAQHEYIEESNFDPVVQYLRKKTGLDITTQPLAVQDAVWSASVQHGGARTFLRDAINSVQVNRTAPEYSEALLNEIYEKRIDYVNSVKKMDPATKSNLVNIRYPDELSRALQMLKK